MRTLIKIILVNIVLSSCQKYEQPSLITLSGEYIVDKITYSKVEYTNSPNEIVYNPGYTYINPMGSFPLDTINVGFTRWHFDYSVISFAPYVKPSGQMVWTKQYFYTIINHHSNYDLGYVDINMDNGSRRILKIVDDGIENIVLRTSGQWNINGRPSSNESITIYLTRVGP